MLFQAGPPATAGEIIVVADADDAPEPIEGGIIDLGEAVAQQLALALDPYPRAPGAAILPEIGVNAGAAVARSPEPGPFAALAGIIGRRRE